MAAYDYRCRECDQIFEVRQPIDAVGIAPRCPEGHRDVVRIWSAVSVVGSGAAGAAASAGPAGRDGCCGGGCCG